MSYNGIGLTTPRGSGTNGYVMRNLANVYKPKDKDNFRKPDELGVPSLRKPNNDIIEHDKKRKIELKCMEFEQMLEDQGYTEGEIEKRVTTYRQSLIEEHVPPKDKHGRVIVKETHEIAEAQQIKNEKLRQAFGISDSFIDGSSFDPERRAKEAAAKAAIEEVKYALIPSPASSEDEPDETDPKSKKRSRKSFSPVVDAKKKKKKKKHKRKDFTPSQDAVVTKSRRQRSPSKDLFFVQENSVLRDERNRRNGASASPLEKRNRRHENSASPLERGHQSENRTKDRYSKPTSECKRSNRFSPPRDRSPSGEPPMYKKKKRSIEPKKTKRRSPSPSSEVTRDTRREARNVPQRSSSPPEVQMHMHESKTTKRRSPSSDTKRQSRKRPRRSSSMEARSHESKINRRSNTPASSEDRRRFGTKANDRNSKSLRSKITVRAREAFRDSQDDHEPTRNHQSPSSSPLPEWRYTKVTAKDRSSVWTKSKPADRNSSREERCHKSPAYERDTPSPLRRSYVQAKQKKRYSNLLESKVVRSEVPTKKRQDSASPTRDKSLQRYSPVEKHPDRYSDILSDMPKKTRRPETSRTDRESIETGRKETTPIKSDKAKTTAVVAPIEVYKPTTDEPSQKIADATDTSLPKVSASDMVDEAVKKTASALMINREKTLKSLKELLSSNVDKKRSRRSPSSSASSRKQRKRSSSSSSSASSSSDSSRSSRSPSSSSSSSSSEKNSTSSSSSSSSSSDSDSSKSSRSPSRGHERKKRRRMSRSDSTSKVRKSRRSSSYGSSDSSRSRSSRSRSPSRDRKKKTTKKKKHYRRRSKRESDRDSKSSSSSGRSPSIPRRKGSPSFLERRRITSKKPSKSSSSSSSSSEYVSDQSPHSSSDSDTT